MTTKISPPLQVPILKGMPNHYQYEEDMWFFGPKGGWLRSRVREILNRDKPEFADLPEPSAFGKVFIRREKKEKKKFLPVHYVISSASGSILLAYRTKKAAMKALKLGFGRWPTFYTGGRFTLTNGKQGIVHLPIGSYIWRADPEKNEFDDFKDNSKYPITTRRCAACPNKNSMQGMCGCSLFYNIANQGKPWAWTPPHEARHKLKQDLKTKPPTMSEESLVIYNIKIKGKK